MATILDCVVKIKVGNPDGVTDRVASDLHVSGVCCCQDCFVLLCPKQVDGMDSTILLHEARKVSIESRLRGLVTGNLDSLAKRLEPWLRPEYCLGARAMEHIHKGE